MSRIEDLKKEARDNLDKKITIVSCFCQSNNIISEAMETVEGIIRTVKPPYEFLIIDNDVPEPVLRQLMKYEGDSIKVIHNGWNLGYSGGYDTGFRASSLDSRFVFTMDSDVVMDEPGWARGTLEELSRTGVWSGGTTLFISCIPKFVCEEIVAKFRQIKDKVDSSKIPIKLLKYINRNEGTFDEGIFVIPSDIDYIVMSKWAGYPSDVFGFKHHYAPGSQAKTLPDPKFEQLKRIWYSRDWQYFRDKWSFIAEHFPEVKEIKEIKDYIGG